MRLFQCNLHFFRNKSNSQQRRTQKFSEREPKRGFKVFSEFRERFIASAAVSKNEYTKSSSLKLKLELLLEFCKSRSHFPSQFD